MTRTRPDDQERAALSRPCPYCAAGEGTWCMNYRSEYVTFLHAKRDRNSYRGWPERTAASVTNRQDS